jgi:transposase
MAGVIQAIEWQESAEELYERYRTETDVQRRKRLHALWRVREGSSETEAAHQAGIGRRTLARWLGWYREGGLAEVLRRVPGHAATGVEGWLSPAQLRELYERTAQGQFQSTPEVQAWVEEHWGVSYRYHGMYSLLARLSIHPKVPRPQAEKADPKKQRAWKRGGSQES